MQRFIMLFYFHSCLNFSIITSFLKEYDILIIKSYDDFLPKIGVLW